MSSLPRGSAVRRDAGLYGYERALRRHGVGLVAGIDEAGRGACAGPLVAGAAILPAGRAGIIPGLADSKLLTEKARERCYTQVVRRALAWSVVVVPHDECDRLGMHVANIEALRRAVAQLDVRPDYVLSDGFPVDGLGAPALRCGRATGSRPASRPRRCSPRSPATGSWSGSTPTPGVRLQDAQGLHHRRPHRGADRARSVVRCTGCASSTYAGPPASSRRSRQRGATGCPKTVWTPRENSTDSGPDSTTPGRPAAATSSSSSARRRAPRSGHGTWVLGTHSVRPHAGCARRTAR